MPFTTAEKIQFAMLRDLAKEPEDRELDFDFLWAAIVNDDLWAIDRKYQGLRLNVDEPDDVRVVSDILDM